MARIESVCVYCGSSPGSAPVFIEQARALGTELGRSGIRLIYGGGGVGLMGEVASAAAAAGGAVTGIIPEFLVSREGKFGHASEMILTTDMHERKRLMFDRADAFVALPGGVGTLEELVEQLTWAQLGQHRKPILVANIAGFWDPFLSLLDHMRTNAFIHGANPVELLVANAVSEILPKLRTAASALPDSALHGTEPEAAISRL